MAKTTITANDIIGLLAARHSGDVFVPECKNGPSQGSTHLRMDAWAMVRSWARPRVVAYEVKVSRGDFIQDNKWQGYLSYCNEFYFVCPSKVIVPEELPSDVGLIYPSANATRLYTKRKAVYRDIVINEDVLRYVLICRAKIPAGGSLGIAEDQTAYWAEWLTRRELTKDLGKRVGATLREVIESKVTETASENARLKSEIANLRDIREILDGLGFNRTPDKWAVERRIAKLQEAVPPELIGLLRRTQDNLTALQDALTDIGSPDTP